MKKFLVLCLLLVACKEEPSAPLSPEAALAQKGRSIYMSACIACHNVDPKKDGAIGPAIYGSSRELLEARIMSASYPPGYQPKRQTKAMNPLPHLKNEIDAIYQFLNQP
jgi:mono/diheme cytochrome c family protein